MTNAREIEARFWKELKASPFVMIGLEHTEGVHSQPMTVHFEGNGPLWIYTTRDNRLVTGLAGGEAHAMVQYVGKDHGLFACLHGKLVVDNNPVAIDRFWSKQVEAWYPQGRGDPSLTLARFNPDHAEMWLADLSVGGVFKLLFGGDLRPEGEDKHAEFVMNAPKPPVYARD